MNTLTVSAIVRAPVEVVWKAWNDPVTIMEWSHASEDWHTPYAQNDLQIGKSFLMRMASKDGKQSFDFVGTYTDVKEYQSIEYSMDDGRKVKITFESIDDGETKVTEIFDPETINSLEVQQKGWQAILDNFKLFVERGGSKE